MTKKQRLCCWFNIWRLWVVWLAFGVSAEREKIAMDIAAWNKVKGFSMKDPWCLAMYMLTYREFRNLFLFRIQDTHLGYLVKILFPPLESLYLACPKIGGGLFIQHGFSTIVAAECIGENCWINQQVTVGYKGDKAPRIGNNCKNFCGALVLGDITVHDGATVGAGAVVVRNVRENAVVVGNPARELTR